MTTTKQINQAIKIVEEFRKIEANIPSQVIQVFLEIAREPGIATRDMFHRANISPASGSRALAFLSEKHRSGKAGMGLISTERHPDDWKTLICRMTPKGDRLLRDIGSILDD